jgi:hypothetical protein
MAACRRSGLRSLLAAVLVVRSLALLPRPALLRFRCIVLQPFVAAPPPAELMTVSPDAAGLTCLLAALPTVRHQRVLLIANARLNLLGSGTSRVSGGVYSQPSLGS